jgi:broad specificity phosphatase PhoE
MNKTLYLIRHGQAKHNELFLKIGTDAFYGDENIDTKLTEEGHVQSKELGDTWINKNDIELILTSTQSRCLQTTMNIFRDTDIPIFALECLREYPLGSHTCNKRSDKYILEEIYKKINFDDLLSDKDQLWRPDRVETIEELDERILLFKEYLKLIPQTKIAIVSHSGFIGRYKDKYIRYIENGDTELKHCYPYEIEFKN